MLIILISIFKLFLKVSHSESLGGLSSNFSCDLTMALKMLVKFAARFNGYSMSVYTLAFGIPNVDV